MRPAPLSAAIVSALLTVSFGAWPGAGPKRVTANHVSIASGAMRYGKSVGSPTEGRLVGGAHLDESPYLRIVPGYSPGDVRWGLEPLVDAIDRAARSVRRQFPDAVTSVGHLSRSGGGDIGRHHSHESGRDADIGFFIKNHTNTPLLAGQFIPFKGDGSSASWRGAYFDDARNWALVQSLITDPDAHVTHIFVASPLRARLLAVAERLHAPDGVRLRAAELLQQPHGALPHDDHFHVRIRCPANMTSCIEYPTVRVHTPALAARDARHGHDRADAHKPSKHSAVGQASNATHAGAARRTPASQAHARESTASRAIPLPPPSAHQPYDEAHEDEPADHVHAIPDLHVTPPPTSIIVDDPDGLGDL